MDDKSVEKYLPKLNPWFSSEIVYEGQGIAVFKNPVGSIEGKTVISVNELGDLEVEMEYERLIAENATDTSGDFRFLKFLYRHSSKDGTFLYHTGEERKNPCSKLTVDTQDGFFVSEGKIDLIGNRRMGDNSEHAHLRRIEGKSAEISQHDLVESGRV